MVEALSSVLRFCFISSMFLIIIEMVCVVCVRVCLCVCLCAFVCVCVFVLKINQWRSRFLVDADVTEAEQVEIGREWEEEDEDKEDEEDEEDEKDEETDVDEEQELRQTVLFLPGGVELESVFLLSRQLNQMSPCSIHTVVIADVHSAAVISFM